MNESRMITIPIENSVITQYLIKQNRKPFFLDNYHYYTILKTSFLTATKEYQFNPNTQGFNAKSFEFAMSNF